MVYRGNPSICTSSFLPVPEKSSGKFDVENVLHFSLIIDLTIENTKALDRLLG